MKPTLFEKIVIILGFIFTLIAGLIHGPVILGVFLFGAGLRDYGRKYGPNREK
jgi:hypothetical protein